MMVMVNIYVARHGQDVDNVNGILNGHRNEPLTDLGRQQANDVAKKMLDAGFRLSSSSSSNNGDGDNDSSSSSSGSSKVALSAIYSSPLTRAHDTAQIFAQILSTTPHDGADGNKETNNNSAVKVLDDLIERDFGIMTGQPTSSIIERCGMGHILATEKINYFLDPEGAETFPNLIDRANRLLGQIQSMYNEEEEEEEGGKDQSGSGEGEDSKTKSKTTKSILLVTHGDFGKMIYAAYYNLPWEDVLKQFHFGNSEVLLLARDSPPENAHVFTTVQYNA